jgi:hypothetical protein
MEGLGPAMARVCHFHYCARHCSLYHYLRLSQLMLPHSYVLFLIIHLLQTSHNCRPSRSRAQPSRISPRHPTWSNAELEYGPRSPHSNSDPTGQVPSRSPERRVCGTMGLPVAICPRFAQRCSGCSISSSETHRSPVVSGPETYTHSPPASRTQGTLLMVAMKPLPSGWPTGSQGAGVIRVLRDDQ